MSKRNGRKKVLFVCMGNACRSPMAEAIARRGASDVFEAFSAGLEPIGYIARMTKQTLLRNGCWVRGLESKGISTELWNQADIVINMSGRTLEPSFHEGAEFEDWRIEDPFGERPGVYQRVFEEIQVRVAELADRCRQQIWEKGNISSGAAPGLPDGDAGTIAPGTRTQTAQRSGREAPPFRSKPFYRQRNPGVTWRRWSTLATLGVLLGVSSLTFEWLMIQRDVRSEGSTSATQKTTAPSDLMKAPLRVTTAPSPATSSPEKSEAKTPIVEHPAPETVENIQRTSPESSPRPTNAATKSSSNVIVEAASHHTESVLRPGQLRNYLAGVAAKVNISPVDKKQAASSTTPLPPQLEAQITQPPNMLLLSSNSVRPAKPKQEESSVALTKQSPNPASVAGAVTVQADPYPSLRIPDEHSAKKQRQATSLQLGYLLSRVEPVYPEEAKQQGIEGTVKIHAIIGRNGSVVNLASVNGPPILAASATNAVRQWRYTETLLAGHSVETEEDIDVTFRLSHPPAPRE